MIFWCLAAGLFVRKGKASVIAGTVLIATCGLEFLQLWHPPFLQLVRHTVLGAIVLGISFTWTDFPYYIVGALVGWLWIRWLPK